MPVSNLDSRASTPTGRHWNLWTGPDSRRNELIAGRRQPTSIYAFGPNGEDVTILNEFSVRSWYEKRFGGRKVLV